MTQMTRPAVQVLASLVFPALLYAQQPLPVEELWRTDGTREGLQLDWVTDALIDTDGKIWILDEYAARVSVWTWPSHDAPPEDPRVYGADHLEAPVVMTGHPEDGVAILDVVRRSILRISSEGEITLGVGLDEHQFLFPKDLLALDNGTFVVLGGSTGAPWGFHVFNPEGDLTARALEAESVGHARTTSMLAGGVALQGRDGRIIVSLAQRPGLYAVDATTGAAEILAPMEALFPDQGSDFVSRSDQGGAARFRFRWFFTRPTALLALPSGMLLHVVTNQEGNEGIWETRRPDGTLVARYHAERGYRPLAYAGSGIFLAMHLDPQSREQVLVGLRVPVGILQ